MWVLARDGIEPPKQEGFSMAAGMPLSFAQRARLERVVLQREIQGVGEACQRVVDLVRDARGETAGRCQLLRLAQRILDQLLLVRVSRLGCDPPWTKRVSAGEKRKFQSHLLPKALGEARRHSPPLATMSSCIFGCPA